MDGCLCGAPARAWLDRGQYQRDRVWAEGRYERFPVLIAELLEQKVEVIVTAGTPATQAVKKATTSVPLVMVAVGDPVATGIAASLRRPGGNITGLTSTGTAGLPPSAVRRPTR